MARRTFLITPILLREWIPLPVSTTIVGSMGNDGYVEVVVDDPICRHISDSQPPTVKPLFRKVPAVNGDPAGVTEFAGWEDSDGVLVPEP